MNEKIIITKEKYTIFQPLAMVWVGFMAIYVDMDFSQPALPVISLIVLFILFYFSIWSVQVVLSEHAIYKGENRLFFRKRINIQSVNWEDYKGLTITQNEKKYFDIKVLSTNGNGFVVESIPNKKPAEEKLKALELEIKKAWD